MAEDGDGGRGEERKGTGGGGTEDRSEEGTGTEKDGGTKDRDAEEDGSIGGRGAKDRNTEKIMVQKGEEPQKNKVQNAREEKAGTRKAEAGQVLPKDGASPQDSGKEAKAAPGTASKTAPKAPAENAAGQAVGKKASGDAATEGTIPGNTVLGKGNRGTGKMKPKTGTGVKAEPTQPAGVVLTDKDSIML